MISWWVKAGSLIFAGAAGDVEKARRGRDCVWDLSWERMGEGEARVKQEGRGVCCRRARAEVAMLAMREAGRRARGRALLMAVQTGD